MIYVRDIINLCNENNFEFSVNFLTEELERVNQLGIKYLVLHPGSHVGDGVDIGINRIIEIYNKAMFKEQMEDAEEIKEETCAEE